VRYKKRSAHDLLSDGEIDDQPGYAYKLDWSVLSLFVEAIVLLRASSGNADREVGADNARDIGDGVPSQGCYRGG
jgi:hypothetical protein